MEISGIENILVTQLEAITLKEMDNVKLMDRTDTKFTFHISALPKILEDIKSNYKVLSIGNKRISKYETLYYDTPNFDLYLKHHSGKLNRYKIRHRTYVESSLGYLEVKFKNNKGRTIKERIKKKDVPQTWDENSTVFLNSKLPFASATLFPVVWINYMRITLVSIVNAERVTLDLDMEFLSNDKKTSLSQLVIAEVKQHSKKDSAFLGIMKQHHLREGSMSKYCMAIAFMNDDIKKNSFKLKLNKINKILNYDATASIC
jgi:hypothetical protein